MNDAMTKPTPAPWKAIRENPYDDPIEGWCWTVRGPLVGDDVSPYFTWIAGCGYEGETNAEANARLIAAAPDLLAALAFAASCIKSGEPWTPDCERVINGAFAKAHGKVASHD